MEAGGYRSLWCYLLMPLSGCCFLWSRTPEVRFHAWQSSLLGIVATLGLIVASGLEVCFGWMLSPVARIMEVVAPAFAAIMIVLWLWCIVRIGRGKQAPLPVIGRWASARGGEKV
jgi:uncharacterized membrane protein